MEESKYPESCAEYIYLNRRAMQPEPGSWLIMDCHWFHTEDVDTRNGFTFLRVPAFLGVQPNFDADRKATTILSTLEVEEYRQAEYLLWESSG